ncbi:MAG: hypothetical protein A2X78_02425 [Gammaproteobacteria bacterium GWE2_37_16]|nr:MAG: hypothetical protein A2X78_02425 [Gammaproteobacteria bacterium GWE2_37_16]
MRRIYQSVVVQHFTDCEQMLLLAGPRQVGKTTISLAAKELADPNNFVYLNWDEAKDMELITRGSDAVAARVGLDLLSPQKPLVIFDEIHKYLRWKKYIKGFYDHYKDRVRIIITGSAKLDVYRKDGDSLMGRYFLYRIHPFSIAECITSKLPTKEIRAPKPLDEKLFTALWKFGGFPEPFLKQDERFHQRWKNLRLKQLFREDIRDLTQIQELSQMEVFARLLKYQPSQLLSLTNLAQKAQVSVNTAKRWVNTLESFYYCFLIRPWTKKVTRSLLKEPKIYLWDWADIEDIGAKTENFVAAHLLKAVHFWTDYGFGDFQLHFLRDKEKREVDFLVTKNDQPWFLVEVKVSDTNLSKSLELFQNQTGAKHAFQVVFNMDYVDADCFAKNKPIVVPLKTFLSQLI